MQKYLWWKKYLTIIQMVGHFPVFPMEVFRKIFFTVLLSLMICAKNMIVLTPFYSFVVCAMWFEPIRKKIITLVILGCFALTGIVQSYACLFGYFICNFFFLLHLFIYSHFCNFRSSSM